MVRSPSRVRRSYDALRIAAPPPRRPSRIASARFIENSRVFWSNAFGAARHHVAVLDAGKICTSTFFMRDGTGR